MLMSINNLVSFVWCRDNFVDKLQVIWQFVSFDDDDDTSCISHLWENFLVFCKKIYKNKKIFLLLGYTWCISCISQLYGIFASFDDNDDTSCILYIPFIRSVLVFVWGEWCRNVDGLDNLRLRREIRNCTPMRIWLENARVLWMTLIWNSRIWRRSSILSLSILWNLRLSSYFF